MNDRNEPQLRPGLVRTLRIAFGVALAAAVLAGLLVEKHPYFGIEGTFGFFAWYGFAACVILLLLARLLGMLLERPETFYDE